MKRIIIVLIISACLFACGEVSKNSSQKAGNNISIDWVDNLGGDFSFTNNWDYPEGVYKNEFGELSCDGFCPPEIDAMKDSKGRILKDSLKAFYQLVDTTHQAYTIKSEAWSYEWAGTNFIEVQQKSKDSVECYTLGNVATHCSLQLDVVNDICTPRIVLNSITADGNKIYPCTGGYVKIDKNLWKKGIMKADFNLNFDHKENPKQPMYWKGKIYANINKT
ncbi:MAG: hypothetical protein WBP45_05825 [Daejeonella sp.]